MGKIDYNKEFSFKGITICRNDYESMPCPIRTDRVSDESMQKLAETIYDVLVSQYRFTDDDIAYWTEHAGEIDDRAERFDEAFWRELEGIGIRDFGMTYYEDEPDIDTIVRNLRDAREGAIEGIKCWLKHNTEDCYLRFEDAPACVCIGLTEYASVDNVYLNKNDKVEVDVSGECSEFAIVENDIDTDTLVAILKYIGENEENILATRSEED